MTFKLSGRATAMTWIKNAIGSQEKKFKKQPGTMGRKSACLYIKEESR